MNQYIQYIVIAIIGVSFFILKVLPMLKKVRKVAKAFQGTKFKENSLLSDSQQRQVATSAIYASQQGAYVNALETGMAKMDLKEILIEWWGISNKQEAIQTLEELKQCKFQSCLPIVAEAIKQKEVSTNDFLAQQIDRPYALQAIQEYAYNLKVNLSNLSDLEIISSIDDVSKLGVAGWDCGRLSFITRLCFDIGYISEAEAWQNLELSHKIAQQYFSNWEDFSKSYALGRSMWNGSDSRGIYTIARNLIDNQPSPYELGF